MRIPCSIASQSSRILSPAMQDKSYTSRKNIENVSMIPKTKKIERKYRHCIPTKLAKTKQLPSTNRIQLVLSSKQLLLHQIPNQNRLQRCKRLKKKSPNSRSISDFHFSKVDLVMRKSGFVNKSSIVLKKYTKSIFFLRSF